MPNDAMPDQDHFDILKHGVDTWNKWRSEHPDIRPNLGGADLTQASLHGIDLHGAYLPRITLRFADLIEANLNEAYLIGAWLRGADLTQATLSGADLHEAILIGAWLRGAILEKADLTQAILEEANLTRANLTQANLLQANLTRANLTQATLSGANLSGATLTLANLTGANLTGATLDRANLSGATLTLADLTGAILEKADLTQANLSSATLQANLREANLRLANLTRANLTQATLSGANLRLADLTGANLNGTTLINADLTRANLTGANLTGANLAFSNISEAYFDEANLTGCNIYAISAWNVQLQNTIQTGLIITPSNEATITVDNLEVAQFIYLLLNNPKIRDVIDTIAKKAVLILGRFTPKRKAVLEALREALRTHGYLPILFDFEKPSSRDVTETVSVLAHLARFIVADLTEPSSIPKELEAIVPTLAVPVQPLLEGSTRPYAMFQDYWKYQWVLEVYRYNGLEELLTSLKEHVIEPAERKAKELATLRAQEFEKQ